MLGSAFDGERANAARLIAGMAEKRKATIVDLVGEALGRASSYRQHYNEQPKREQPKQERRSSSTGNKLLRELGAIASKLDALEFVLTEWECNFAADVAERYTQDYELSDKQLVIVERILKKVRAAESAEQWAQQ